MNTNILTKNKKRGFTLVELLVVIAILAILASVTVVGYISFTKRAKDSNALTELTEAREVIRTDYLNEGTHYYKITNDESNNYTAVEDNSTYNLTLTYDQTTKTYTFNTTVYKNGKEDTSSSSTTKPTWDTVIKAIFSEDLSSLKGTFYVNVNEKTITSIAYASSSEGYAKWDIAEDEIATADSTVASDNNTVSITTIAK